MTTRFQIKTTQVDYLYTELGLRKLFNRYNVIFEKMYTSVDQEKIYVETHGIGNEKGMKEILSEHNLSYETKKIEKETQRIIVELIVKKKYDKKLKMFYEAYEDYENKNMLGFLKQEVKTLMELYKYGKHSTKRTYWYDNYLPSKIKAHFNKQLYYVKFLEEVIKSEEDNLMPFKLDV